MTTDTFDEARAETFAQRMTDLISDGSLALLCSIGDQTGLFDVWSNVGEVTSAELAGAAALDERYVREWLGGIVCGGIADYDPARSTYSLPAEHSAFLTSAAGPNNLGRTTQFLSLLAEVEQEVIDKFRNGGGVQYSSYPRFHRVMADNSAIIFDAALVDGILPLAEGVPARLREGIDVADIGCGTGHAVNLMARTFPASRFVGYDFSPDAVESAWIEAKEWGLDNARFELIDVQDWRELESFDLVTAFDAIHDQAQPARVLENVQNSLRPGGVFLMVDIKASSHLQENLDNPFAPFFYTVSVMHCMTVSLALDGVGLGTVWGKQRAIGMLDDAGFESIEVHEIEDEPINYYYVARKAS